MKLEELVKKWEKVLNYETEDEKTKRLYKEGKISKEEAFRELL